MSGEYEFKQPSEHGPNLVIRFSIDENGNITAEENTGDSFGVKVFVNI